jgi:hypothetical protein
VYAQVFAREGTYDYDKQRDKKHIHTETLSLRFLSADERADEQPRREPRRGDPKQTDL